MRSEKAHMCSTPSLRSFPNVAFETVPMFRLIDDGPLLSLQRRLLSASLHQAINGVIFLALYLQVVSQAPQHLSSSKKQVTCDGCFACLPICLAIIFSKLIESVRMMACVREMLSPPKSMEHLKIKSLILSFCFDAFYLLDVTCSEKAGSFKNYPSPRTF